MLGPFEAADLLDLAEDLLGEPRASGWIPSLIRDGLLSGPQTRGIPGQRGGRLPGTWTRTDRLLFERILTEMARGKSRAELSNIIALAWLDAGPEYVPVSQLRRALCTYRDGTRSRRATRRTALLLAELLAGGPGMSRTARRRFIDALENALHSGAIDRDALSSPAFDPDGVGPPPLREALSTDGLIAALSAWQAGCNGIDELDERAAKTARSLYRQTAGHYAQLRPQLEQHRGTGGLFGSDTLELLRNNACAYTLLTLGCLLSASTRGLP